MDIPNYSFDNTLLAGLQVIDTFPVAAFLYELPILIGAKKILEIGVGSYGVSTKIFLAVCKKTGGHLWSVDINPDCGKLFTDPNWTFICSPSQQIDCFDIFDVVLIDGDHNFDMVYTDLKKFVHFSH